MLCWLRQPLKRTGIDPPWSLPLTLSLVTSSQRLGLPLESSSCIQVTGIQDTGGYYPTNNGRPPLPHTDKTNCIFNRGKLQENRFKLFKCVGVFFSSQNDSCILTYHYE